MVGDPAVDQQRAGVGHLEHLGRELLHHQDRQALPGDAAEDLVQLLDHLGRQAHRQLVDEQDRRVHRQGAGHREHLLLTAGELARQLGAALGEARELLEGLLQDVRVAGTGEAGHLEVLGDGEVREDAPPLGDHAQPAADQALGRDAGDRMAVDRRRALRRRQLPGHDLQRGRLARAVGPEHRADFAGPDGEADVLQHVDAAVPGGHAVELYGDRPVGFRPRTGRRPAR